MARHTAIAPPTRRRRGGCDRAGSTCNLAREAPLDVDCTVVAVLGVPADRRGRRLPDRDRRQRRRRRPRAPAFAATTKARAAATPMATGSCRSIHHHQARRDLTSSQRARFPLDVHRFAWTTESTVRGAPRQDGSGHGFLVRRDGRRAVGTQATARYPSATTCRVPRYEDARFENSFGGRGSS